MMNDPKTGPSSPPVIDRLTGLSAAKQALLEQRLRSRKDAGHASIPRRSGAGPAPLSFAQERLWLLDQLLGSSAAYNVPRALQLRGDLDTSALERALAALVERHEILRTVY